MIFGLVDPTLLLPPLDEASALAWVEAVDTWGGVLAPAYVTAACPRAMQDAALAVWWEKYEAIEETLRCAGLALGHGDLLRLMEELRGRITDAVVPEPYMFVLDTWNLRPEYVGPDLSESDRDCFAEAAATLAAFRHRTAERVGVISRASSWTGDGDAVEVNAVIGLEEPPDHAGQTGDGPAVREFLPLWKGSPGICRAFSDDPCGLIVDPKSAVRHIAIALGIEPETLRFDLGPNFVASFVAMGYANEPTRAGTCWRAMAMIAAGRVSEMSGLAAHPHHEGKSGSPAIRDLDGRLLFRGALAQHSPNAHRLFWWSGDHLEFAGIAGHDDEPPI